MRHGAGCRILASGSPPVPARDSAEEPQAAIPDTREVSIEVNGATLSALHLTLPNPKGVVFFLHGNGDNLAAWFTNPEFYRRVNLTS